MQTMRFFGVAVVFVFFLSIPSVHAQTVSRIQQYSDQVQKDLVQIAHTGGTGQFAKTLRTYAEKSDEFTMKDVNDYFLNNPAVNEHPGRPITVYLKIRKQEVDEINTRAQRASLTCFHFVQDSAAQLVEVFRNWKASDSSQPASLDDVRSASAEVYSDLSPEEIRVPVLADELEDARVGKLLAEANKSRPTPLSFSKDKGVNNIEDVPLERFDQPRESQRAFYQWMTKWRTGTASTTAFLGGVAGGLMGNTLLPGAVSGAAVGGLEYQFGKYSGWWNDKVWSRYGFVAIGAANFVIPIFIKTISIAVLALQGKAYAALTALELGRFFVDVTFSFATTMATLGATQVFLAKQKNKGQIGEFLRFKMENILAVNNVVMRMFQLALIAVAGVATGLGVHWGIFEPLNIHHWGLAKIIGLADLSVVFAAVSLPMWIKLKWGDKAYDYKTAELINSGGAQPPKRGIRSVCQSALSRLSSAYTWSKE